LMPPLGTSTPSDRFRSPIIRSRTNVRNGYLPWMLSRKSSISFICRRGGSAPPQSLPEGAQNAGLIARGCQLNRYRRIKSFLPHFYFVGVPVIFTFLNRAFSKKEPIPTFPAPRLMSTAFSDWFSFPFTRTFTAPVHPS
jgi:hypothetical protein